MVAKNVSPNRLVIVVIVLINIVIIREGSLLDNRLYLFLIGTIPLLFYLISYRRKRIL